MNEKEKNTVNIYLNTESLDVAIEKVKQLKSLLSEVKETIDSLNQLKLFK